MQTIKDYKKAMGDKLIIHNVSNDFLELNRAQTKWAENACKRASKLTGKNITHQKVKNRLMSRLLSTNGNTKIDKNEELTAALTLAPHKLSGFNVCPWSGDCAFKCIHTSGRMPMVLEHQVVKTLGYFLHPEVFNSQLNRDLINFKILCDKKGIQGYGRLNTLSDIDFTDIIRSNKGIKFYDYTKSIQRFNSFINGELPLNYWLTLSRDEFLSVDHIKGIIKQGFNVSVVFWLDESNGDTLPKTWEGMPVVSGENSDNRWKDKRGVIVGLKAKGKARQLPQGNFVIIDHKGRKYA